MALITIIRKMIVTLALLTLAWSHLIDGGSANLVASDSNLRRIEPPIYVIQDDDEQLQQDGATRKHLTAKDHSARSWNNHKLRTKTQADYDKATSRSAKQIFYTDEPVPYYHSYKYMGLGQGEGAFADQYYQPLRRNNYYSELPWYAAYNPSVVGGYPRLQSTKGGTKSSSSSPSRGATKGSSSKGGGRRKVSPSKRRHQQHPVKPAYNPPTALEPTFDQSNSEQQNKTEINRARAAGKKNLVCYYGTWAVYRPDAGKYPVENIDPFLCTHIIYGFTGLSYDNMIKPLDPWNDLEDNYGKGAMKRFTNLKRINPDLKTLVAIGGWNEGSIKYSKMASEPEARAKFVQSVVEFLDKYNFDGLDLDWEYPGARGGHSYDKQNFVRLLRELKEAFKPKQYLLTAAVSAGKWFIDPAYDIGQVSRYLDLINLMAYDYHGGWETKTGMNAPLFNSPKHDLSKEDAMLNVNWSVNYWLQQGAPAEKIMLGVGSYGRSFTLDKASVNGINAPASQKGQAGPYTREPGSLGYNEICEAFQRQPNSWTVVRDPDYLAPYAYNDRQWVGYDDMQSLALKAQFAKSMGLGGMMMWSIETDDFLGRCHNEKYPLLNTIKRVMNGKGTGSGSDPSSTTTRRPIRPASTSRRPPVIVTPTKPQGEVEDDEPVRPAASSTKRPTMSSTRRPPTSGSTTSTTTKRPKPPSISTTTTSTSTTTTQRPRPPPPQPQQPTGEFVCRGDGMFADPRNCRKFIRCVSSGSSKYSIFRFDCGPGTAFNEQQQYCDFVYNVPSCQQQQQQQQQVSRRLKLDQLYREHLNMNQNSLIHFQQEPFGFANYQQQEIQLEE